MAPSTRYLLASALLAVGISAQTCPFVPYSPLPDYPATNKCAPQNYDFELTLGKVSFAKAKAECQEECTASGSDCSSVVIELHSVKGSDEYEAKCLLFKEGNADFAPETCYSKESCMLQGYTKGIDILPCYSASPVAATSYCQSVLSATVTKTATVTPGASTRISNFTLTAFQNRTAILTNTIDATTTLTDTTTIYTSPVVTTNVLSFAATASVTTTVTTTTTSTATATKTVTQQPALKFKKKRDATVPPPSCITSDTPVTKLSSACVIYNAEPTTVTTTTTLGVPLVTRINNQTLTITRPVTEYVSITVTSITDTATAPETITSPQTATSSVTQTTTTTSTRTLTVTTTTTTITTKTVQAAPSVFCGLPDNYVATTSATGDVTCANTVPTPSSNALFRIEGKDDTPFEGCIVSGPRNITTPSGGTHLCDGTNGNANPAPGTTPTDQIDAAGRLKGFGYDGTWYSTFSDFFIQSIAGSTQTGTSFWGVLANNVYTPTGGCEYIVRNGDSSLWAYDVFNKNFLLQASPGWAVLLPGQSVTVTISLIDPNSGMNNGPAAGATFNGQTVPGNGQVVITAPSAAGCYQWKATRSDSIRSNAFYMNVYDSF